MGAFSVTVAYRDGRAYWNKKNYPAGIFATNFLNVFYKNDTAARISVFSDEINHNIRLPFGFSVTDSPCSRQISSLIFLADGT